MLRIVGALALAAIGIPALLPQGSVADALRTESKKLGPGDLPPTVRAISLGSGGNEMMGGFGMYGLMGAGRSQDGGKTAMFFDLLNAVFVDPDEFAELLEGKRPRIRGYAMSLSSMISSGSQGEEMPTPIFAETWIEAGRVVQWTPRPALTRDALIKAFGSEPKSDPTKGERSQTTSNAKQVALGILMYSGDYDDKFPLAQSTAQAQKAVMPYIKNTETWTTTNPKGGRLLYNTSLSGVEAVAIESPSETPLIWDEFEWPDGGRVVGYTDGHVKVVMAPEWNGKLWPAELKRRAKPAPKLHMTPAPSPGAPSPAHLAKPAKHKKGGRTSSKS